jgi:hypothetical protein
MAFMAVGTFAVMGCSGERELPVANENKTVSFLDKGSLSNPLKVQKPPGKQLTRRTVTSPGAGR